MFPALDFVVSVLGQRSDSTWCFWNILKIAPKMQNSMSPGMLTFNFELIK